jgi:hypothetical protein
MITLLLSLSLGFKGRGPVHSDGAYPETLYDQCSAGHKIGHKRLFIYGVALLEGFAVKEDVMQYSQAVSMGSDRS